MLRHQSQAMLTTPFVLPSPPVGSLSLEQQMPLSLRLVGSRESRELRKEMQQQPCLSSELMDYAPGRKQ